MSFNI